MITLKLAQQSCPYKPFYFLSIRNRPCYSIFYLIYIIYHLYVLFHMFDVILKCRMKFRIGTQDLPTTVDWTAI